MRVNKDHFKNKLGIDLVNNSFELDHYPTDQDVIDIVKKSKSQFVYSVEEVEFLVPALESDKDAVLKEITDPNTSEKTNGFFIAKKKYKVVYS